MQHAGNDSTLGLTENGMRRTSYAGKLKWSLSEEAHDWTDVPVSGLLQGFCAGQRE